MRITEMQRWLQSYLETYGDIECCQEINGWGGVTLSTIETITVKTRDNGDKYLWIDWRC
jgi:hypothetical protein